MNLKPLLANLIIGLILINTGIAQSLKASQNFIQNKDCGFLPNLGQLADEQGNVLTDIKYYAHQAGVQLYCRANKISFVFIKVEHEESNISESAAEPHLPKALKHNDHQNDKIYTSRADMMLIGANPNAKIIASETQAYFENYYMAHTAEEGITNVHASKTLTYQNIYPHIDLVLHSKAKGIKYEYVVHPGGKVSDIQMQWYGLASAQLLASGGINYSMRLDHDKIEMKESAPLSYTAASKVASCFVKQGNSISFKVDNYDHNETLTIDPDLNWGTFFGGDGEDFGTKILPDASGNIIIYGYTSSNVSIATSGAFQSSRAGGYDLYITKFSSGGRQIWGTYYGSSGSERSEAMMLDPSGNIYITGYANTNGLATSGAYQSTIAGGNDGFLAKFNSSGSRLWATYFGGTGEDQAEALAVDASGNVFLSGHTGSKGLATSGAYLTSYNTTVSYNISTYIAKFSSSGSLGWATYFGADNSTYPGDMLIDKSGNLFITGFTSYKSLATKGAYKSVLEFEEAYLAKFSSSGALAWSTYFGGNGSDYGSAITSDVSGNIIIGGYTNSTTGVASTGAYQSSLRGTNNAFLAKFSTAGALSWATYYGGSGTDALYDLCVDADESIYLTGNTTSTDGIATAGAYQSSNAGLQDAFVAKFNKTGNIAWGTYYGGSNVEISFGICTDAFKNVYISGYTFSSNGIATANAFLPIQPVTTSQFSHAFITRFSMPYPNNAGLNNIKSPNNKVCVGYTDTRLSIQNYGTQVLKSLTIGWAVDGVAQNDYHWTGNLAPGDTTTLSLNSAKYYSPGSHSIKAYTSLPNGVQDSMPGNDTIKGKFTSYPLADASWAAHHLNTNLSYHFQLKDSSQARTDYTWILGDGFYCNGYSFNHAFAKAGTYDVKLITFNTFGCVNVKDSTLQVTVSSISPTQQYDVYNINIYPNPFRDKTIIHFNNPQTTQVKISISDMLGKVLYTSATKQYSQGDNAIEINAEEAGLSASGTYFVSIMIGEDIVVKKLVVTGR